MTGPQAPQPTNHRITVREGAEHTRRHRDTLGGPAATHPLGSHGCSLDAQQVRELLATKGCAHLMIYHGRNARGEPTMVLVARDAQGKDLLAADTVLEESWPCPPFCDTNSPLNG